MATFRLGSLYCQDPPSELGDGGALRRSDLHRLLPARRAVGHLPASGEESHSWEFGGGAVHRLHRARTAGPPGRTDPPLHHCAQAWTERSVSTRGVDGGTHLRHGSVRHAAADLELFISRSTSQPSVLRQVRSLRYSNRIRVCSGVAGICAALAIPHSSASRDRGEDTFALAAIGTIGQPQD